MMSEFEIKIGSKEFTSIPMLKKDVVGISFPDSTNISKIEVENLFGLHSYILKLDGNNIDKTSKLIILYGDNGSGKTTILKLVFHLLSFEDNKGHKTVLTRVRFRKFSVTLKNNTIIEAIRNENELIGPFIFRIIEPDKSVKEVYLPVDESGAVRMDNQEKKIKSVWLSTNNTLKSLNLSLYYLPDDRKAQSPFHNIDDNSYDYSIDNEYATAKRILERQLFSSRNSTEDRKSVLEQAIKRTEELLRNEALHASNIGEADTNKVYADIVKRIAKSKGTKKAKGEEESSDILSSLENIQTRSKSYSELGLMSALNVTEVMTALKKASGQQQQFMCEVLRPYVDGLAARLNALQNIQELLQIFIETINEFFSNKRIAFDLGRGISISQDGEPLTPAMLSSGERQLLLLFCNTINARQHASIFIIDEPEISLNVKWQRRLLKALLGIAKGTQVQFLIATHSIELLTQYRRNVVTLKDKAANAI